MEYYREIMSILGELKSRFNKTRRMIEKELGYSKHYIDQAISNKANPTFLKKLKDYFNGLVVMEEENKVHIGEPSINYQNQSNLKGDQVWSQIPQYWDCDYITHASGAQMQPLIQNNALVGGKRLEDPSFLAYGEIYILKISNGLETIRYVLPDPDNSQGLLLQGFDSHTPLVHILHSSISQIYQARFVINPL
jgi:hypothetical protein